MKKLSVFLSLLMFISSLAFDNPASVVSAANDTILFEDDFNDFTADGNVPRNWTAMNMSYAGYIGSETVDAAHGKSLSIAASSEFGNMYIMKQLDSPITAGRVRISYEMRRDGTKNNSVLRFTNGGAHLSESQVFTALQFHWQGNLIVRNPLQDVNFNYSENRWYLVEVILDMTNKMAVYYIDGEEIVRGTTAELTSFNKIYFWQWEKNPGILYIDNLSISNYNNEIPALDKDLIFGDDFNDYTSDGNIPRRWTESGLYKEGLVTSEVVDQAYGTSMCLSTSSSRDNSYIVKEFVRPVTSGRVMVSYEMRKTDDKAESPVLFTGTGKVQNEPETFIALRFNNLGKIVPGNPTSSNYPGYNIDQWYKVDILLDLDVGNAVYYVDGLEIAQGSIVPLKTFNKIYFKQWFKTGGKVYIDNLSVRHYYPSPEIVKIDYIGCDNSVYTNADYISSATKRIDICFNTAMDQNSFNGITLENTSDSTPAVFSRDYNEDTNVLSLVLDEYLLPEKSYKLTVGENVKNKIGTNIKSAEIHHFTTGQGILYANISTYRGAEEITELTQLRDGDTIKVNADIANTTDQKQDLFLLSGEYFDGILKSVKQASFTLLPEEKSRTEDITWTIGDTDKVHSVKSVLWSRTMTPIANVATLEQSPNFAPISVKAETKTVGNIFTLGDSIVFDVNFTNTIAKKRGVNVVYSVEASDGSETIVKEEKFSLASLGSRKAQINVNVDKFDIYNLKITVLTEGYIYPSVRKTTFSCVNMADVTQLNDEMGVQTHFAHFKGDVVKNLDLTQKAGFGWIRDEMYWHHYYDAATGNYTMRQEWEAYLSEAERRGINPYIILDFGHPAYDGGGNPYTDEGLAAFADYAYNLASELKGRVAYFEVWNEINGGFNTNYRRPEDYARMLEYVYPAVKRANPDAVVVGLCTVFTPLKWIRKVFDAGGYEYMDAASLHPYDRTGGPEDTEYVKKLTQVRELMNEYANGRAQKPIWVSEIGWSVMETRSTEREQGTFLVRTMILNKAYGLAERVFVYDLQNDGVDPEEKEHNFGLVRCWDNEDTPWAAKPAYLYLANYNKIMTNSTFIEKIPIDDDTYVFRFKRNKDNKDILTIWSTKPNRQLNLNLGTDEMEFFDWFGNKQNITKNGQVYTFIPDDAPIYVVGNFETLQEAAADVNLDRTFITATRGDVITFNITKTSGPQMPILIQPPSGFEIVENIGFVENNAQIKLKATDDVEDGIQRVKINIGDVIIGNLMINIAQPIGLNIENQFIEPGDYSKWKVSAQVVNNSAENSISGAIGITSPANMKDGTKQVSFSDIPPGEDRIIYIDLPPITENSPVETIFEIACDNGFSVEFAKKLDFAVAGYANTKPVIDGIINQSEWGGSDILIDKPEQIKSMYDYGGADDLSSVSKVMWDEQYLYVSTSVKDDIHHQPHSGSSLFNGDSLQFGIVNLKRGGKGNISDHYTLLTVALTTQGPQLWSKQAIDSNDLLGTRVDNCDVSVVRDSNTTNYEFRIPWTELLLHDVVINEDTPLLFSIAINDNDGFGRRGYGEYNSGIGAEKDSFQYGRIYLENN